MSLSIIQESPSKRVSQHLQADDAGSKRVSLSTTQQESPSKRISQQSHADDAGSKRVSLSTLQEETPSKRFSAYTQQQESPSRQVGRSMPLDEQSVQNMKPRDEMRLTYLSVDQESSVEMDSAKLDEMASKLIYATAHQNKQQQHDGPQPNNLIASPFTKDSPSRRIPPIMELPSMCSGDDIKAIDKSLMRSTSLNPDPSRSVKDRKGIIEVSPVVESNVLTSDRRREREQISDEELLVDVARDMDKLIGSTDVYDEGGTGWMEAEEPVSLNEDLYKVHTKRYDEESQAFDSFFGSEKPKRFSHESNYSTTDEQQKTNDKQEKDKRKLDGCLSLYNPPKELLNKYILVNTDNTVVLEVMKENDYNVMNTGRSSGRNNNMITIGGGHVNYLIRCGSLIYEGIYLEQEEDKGKAIPIGMKLNYFRKSLRLRERFSRRVQQRKEYYISSDVISNKDMLKYL